MIRVVRMIRVMRSLTRLTKSRKMSQVGDNHVETASHENDFSVKTQRVATRTGLSHFILNRPLHHTIGRPHHLLSFSYRLFNFFDRQHTPLALVVVSGHYVSGSFSSFLNATIS